MPVDAGISRRRICTGLKALGVEPTELAGVLITHEHSDHISGLTTLTKQLRPPVYASPGTGGQLCYRIAPSGGAAPPRGAGGGLFHRRAGD
ncbi:MAG: MBL fold metallo-hydrolase [Flavonifractor plautii]